MMVLANLKQGFTTGALLVCLSLGLIESLPAVFVENNNKQATARGIVYPTVAGVINHIYE